MSLDTRIRCVIGSHNMGYSTFYSTLLANLGCIDKRDGENNHLSSGITRICKIKLRHRTYKQKLEVKRRRKYGQLARTWQQVFDERVDKAKKMGTYETGVAMLGEEQHENTQQSSNSKTNSSKQKICDSCGKQGHKTWRARACMNHHLYLQAKDGEKVEKNNTHLTNIGNSQGKVRKEIEKKIQSDVGVEMVMVEGEVGRSNIDCAPLGEVTAAPSSKKIVEEVTTSNFLESEEHQEKKSHI